MGVKARILVIDDDREIVRGIGIRLRAAGYEMLSAHDGQAGLNIAVAEMPDAIILDLRMPVLDGMGFLAQARKRLEPARIPIIVLSANVVEKARRRAMDLGASCFLEKPYDAKRLMRSLECVLAAPAERSDGRTPASAPVKPTQATKEPQR